MGLVQHAMIVLETEDCCSCGAIFGLEQHRITRLKKEGGNFYCPHCGTQQHYVESENQKLKERLAQEKHRAEAFKRQATYEAKSKAAIKGHLTRTKKRIGAGVCPCCNRTFKQLANHMKAKHPEYKED